MNSSYYENKIESMLIKKFPVFFLKIGKISNSPASHKFFEKVLTFVLILFQKNVSLFEKIIEEPNDSTKKFKREFQKTFKNNYTPEMFEQIESLLINFIQYSHFMKASVQENPDKDLIQTILNIDQVEKEIKANVIKALRKSQKKHPSISNIIANTYFGIENSIDKNLSYLKITNNFLRKIKTDEFSIETFFAPQSGRPKDFTFDALLIELHGIALKCCPRSPYANFLKPILMFTAQHYPNLVDKNDVKDWNLLRKRIEYQNKPKKKVEKKNKKSV